MNNTKASTLYTKEDLSNIFNFVKCILCIGVVMIHSYITNDILCFYPRYESFQYVFVKIILERMCVPSFFVISGYFFFTKLESSPDFGYFQKKVSARLKSVLVPFLIANLVTLFFLYIKQFVIGTCIPDGYTGILSFFWGHPVHGLPIDMPLWYLKDLFLITLITPVLYYLIRYVGVFIILLFGYLWYIDMRIPNNIIHDSYGSLLFFSIGAFFSINKIDFVALFSKKKVGLTVMAFYFLFLLMSIITKNVHLTKILSILIFPVIIYIITSLYGKRVINPNGGGGFLFSSSAVVATFFVFLYHYYLPTPVAQTVVKIVSILSIELSLYLQLFLVAAEKVVYSLFIYFSLRKYTPKLVSLIVGGR